MLKIAHSKLITNLPH